MSKENSLLEKTALILVLLMILLQGFYGTYALLDPSAFSSLRGTQLCSDLDSDWVMVYGSRTLFIVFILSILLFKRSYAILMWCALFGTIMPLTDGILAYTAQAPLNVVIKHVATIMYLLVTFMVLKSIVAKKSQPSFALQHDE